MVSSDFRDLLKENMEKAGNLPVVLWVDEQSMPVISAEEDEDGEFCMYAASNSPVKGLLASELITIINEIEYELEDVRATYRLDDEENDIYIMDVGIDETSCTINLWT